eukprot:GHVT01047572.1.p1 GENE.GHVT01047572.1~~GHVT01047572.1.p1  ORF type:complete len:501 (+),score=53.76 GHVT01047572.1:1587-3089(+)
MLINTTSHDGVPRYRMPTAKWGEFFTYVREETEREGLVDKMMLYTVWPATDVTKSLGIHSSTSSSNRGGFHSRTYTTQRMASLAAKEMIPVFESVEKDKSCTHVRVQVMTLCFGGPWTKALLSVDKFVWHAEVPVDVKKPHAELHRRFLSKFLPEPREPKAQPTCDMDERYKLRPPEKKENEGAPVGESVLEKKSKFVLHSVIHGAIPMIGFEPNSATSSRLEKLMLFLRRVAVTDDRKWLHTLIKKLSPGLEGNTFKEHYLVDRKSLRCNLAAAEHRPYNLEKQTGSLLPYFRNSAYYAVIDDDAAPMRGALGISDLKWASSSPVINYLRSAPFEDMGWMPFRVNMHNLAFNSESNKKVKAERMILQDKIRKGLDVCMTDKKVRSRSSNKRSQRLLHLLEMPHPDVANRNNQNPFVANRYITRTPYLKESLPMFPNPKNPFTFVIDSENNAHRALYMPSFEFPKYLLVHLARLALYGADHPTTRELDRFSDMFEGAPQT